MFWGIYGITKEACLRFGSLALQCQTFCVWDGMCVISFIMFLSSKYDLSFIWCQCTLLAVSVLNRSTILVKCSQSLLREAVRISLYNMALLVAIKRNLRKLKEVVFQKTTPLCSCTALYSVPSLFTVWIAPGLEYGRLANSSLHPLLS